MQSLWEETAIPGAHFQPLTRDVRSRVCIIGGGITGLSTALHLAEKGVESIVLESMQPGWGASGRSGGQIIAGLKYDPDELMRRYGEKAGSDMIEFSGQAPALVYDIVSKHGIDCSLNRAGWIQVANSSSAAEKLHRRAEIWRNHGAPVHGLDRTSVAKLLGTDCYSGGLLDNRGGSVQPLSYTRGLANAASKIGAQIFGDTRALKLTRGTSDWVVQTGAGEVRSEIVVIATNSYTDELLPGLAQSIVPVVSMQCATDTLPESVAAGIMPSKSSFSESRRLLRYFRKDEQNRIVIGSRGPRSENIRRSDVAQLHAILSSIFPQLQVFPFKYTWAGLVAMTADQLPHVHVPEENVIAALGYNGRGMALATAMGKCIAELSSADRNGYVGMPITEMKPLPARSLHQAGARALSSWYRLLDYTEERIG